MARPRKPGQTTRDDQTPTAGPVARGQKNRGSQDDPAASDPDQPGQGWGDDQNERAGPGARSQDVAEDRAASAASTHTLCTNIRSQHRRRRYAIKLQQVMDRSFESYVRRNYTDWQWQPGATPEQRAAREAANKQVAELIKAARLGEGNPDLIEEVAMLDDARSHADKVRAKAEARMTRLAEQLSAFRWIEKVHGVGALGLATIVAETGPLDLYANPAKVWKRLGFHVIDGHAGSTWKRPTWRERALTAEEWIANPFSGERYAQMHQIAIWLKNHQWIGAAKTDDGVGKPNGHYGEEYAKRRARTAETHADWTKMHAHMDGLRVMMKEFVKDLWCVWNGKQPKNSRARSAMETIDVLPATAAATRAEIPRGHLRRRKNSRATSETTPIEQSPATAAAGLELTPRNSVRRRARSTRTS